MSKEEHHEREDFDYGKAVATLKKTFEGLVDLAKPRRGRRGDPASSIQARAENLFNPLWPFLPKEVVEIDLTDAIEDYKGNVSVRRDKSEVKEVPRRQRVSWTAFDLDQHGVYLVNIANHRGRITDRKAVRLTWITTIPSTLPH